MLELLWIQLAPELELASIADDPHAGNAALGLGELHLVDGAERIGGARGRFEFR